MELTDEQKKIALDLAAAGKSIQEILRSIKMEASSFYDYRLKNPSFAVMLVRARQEGLEVLADSLLEIPNQEPDVQRARLQSENIRWILSKRKPEIYGDRVDINVTQTVDIGTALTEARKRALPNSYQHSNAIAQPIDVTDSIPNETTGSKSVDTPETRDAIEITSEDIFS